jgi:aminoglycoside phosphotransferase (APT) family kinase protein
LLAQIHTIKVDSFGAFDNDFAKHNHQLKGHHATYRDFIWVGLEENLQRLVSFEIVTQTQSQQMLTVFKRQSYEPTNGPRLIHNDYADWNLLTDGKTVTGILDWDECHGGDPIADLACWSTFYDLSRLTTFLEGYTSQTTLPDDYEARFHYYRLRYTISKMALRAKRYQVDKSDFIKDKLIVGKKALAEEVAWFS